MKKIIILFLLIVSFFSNTTIHYSLADNNSNFTNLIIFAKFADDEEFIFEDDKNGVKTIFNNSYNKSIYSLKEYVNSISGNKIRMNNLFMFDNGGSITLQEKRGYYARYSSTNLDGFNPTSNNIQMKMEFLRMSWAEEVQKLFNKHEKLIDFSGNEYDYSSLDLYKDYDNPYIGYIDNITLIFKRADNDDLDIVYGDPLYTYQANNNRIEYQINNTYKLQSYNYVQCFTDYQNTYVTDDNVEIFALGNIGHETLHSLGLLDLYSQYTNDSGVGRFSSMGRRSTYVPQFITAKERDKLNFYRKENIQQIKKDGIYTINLTKDVLNDEVVSYKIIDEDNEKEYYFEYRKFDSSLNRFDNFKAKFSNNEAYSGVMNNGLMVSMFKSNQALSNLNVKNRDWNYQVLGGNNLDKSDAALNLENNMMFISFLNTTIKIKEMNDEQIVFEINNLPKANISDFQFVDLIENMYVDDETKINLEIEGNNQSFLEIKYSISNNLSNKTTIDQNGNLKIGEDEKSDKITITVQCGNIVKSMDINILKKVCNHSLIFHDKVNSSCLETGLKSYYQCTICLKYFLDSSANEEVNYEDLILNKLEHQLITIEGKSPTCKEDGYTESQKCVLCNTIFIERKKIDKLNHQLSNWIIDIEPTEDAEGHKYIKCLRCNKIIQESIISKKTPVLVEKNNNFVIPIVCISFVVLCFGGYLILKKIKG